jgi:hypothetical protein
MNEPQVCYETRLWQALEEHYEKVTTLFIFQYKLDNVVTVFGNKVVLKYESVPRTFKEQYLDQLLHSNMVK